MSKKNVRAGSDRGSVLILALWALFFLSALALAVRAYVSSSLQVATRIRARLTTRALALAGVEKAIFVLMSDTNDWDAGTETWASGKDDLYDIPLGGGFFSIYSFSSDSSGSVVTNDGMADEERKINLNTASPELLAALAQTAAGLDSATAGGLAAAIVDWRDEDEVTLTGTPESLYYSTRSDSYACRNGLFVVVPELRLVQGVTEEVFEKMHPYLTVHGTGMININTAHWLVLKSLAEWSGAGDLAARESLLQSLESFRQKGGVFTTLSGKTVGDFVPFSLSGPEQDVFLGLLRTGRLSVESTCFRGMAGGRMEEQEEEDVRVEFVYDRTRGVYAYWREW